MRDQIKTRDRPGRRLASLFLLCWICAAPSHAQLDSSAAPTPFRIAYFSGSTSAVDMDALRPALARWAAAISKPVTGRSETEVLSDSHRLEESARAGLHDLYGLFAYQYLALEHTGLLRPAMVTEGSQATASTFLLITRRSAGLRSAEELSDKKIVIDVGGFGELPLIWLATEVAASRPDPDEEGSPARQYRLVQTPARALLPVYFGRADACVITRSAFKDASLFNPEITTRLQICAFSEPLLVSLLAFHRKFPETASSEIAKRVLDRSTQSQHHDLFELIGRQGLTHFEPASLSSLRALYSRYKNLSSPLKLTTTQSLEAP